MMIAELAAKKRFYVRQWVLSIALMLLASPAAYAGAPLDTMKANVDKVLEIMRDPKLKGAPAKEMRKKQLEKIYQEMFNEVEMSRRTLARHWNDLNGEQRREFVDLFRQVLEKAYGDKILSFEYNNEKIVFAGEDILSANKAEVRTRVITASKQIPVDYRLIKDNNRWQVYDVIIENVSLVLNYRNQFNDILASNSPVQLLEILRKKVASH